MLDFLGGGWGWKNLGDVGGAVQSFLNYVRADTATRVPHNSRPVIHFQKGFDSCFPYSKNQ